MAEMPRDRNRTARHGGPPNPSRALVIAGIGVALVLLVVLISCTPPAPGEQRLIRDPQYLAARACGEIGRWYRYNAGRVPQMDAEERRSVRLSIELTDAYCDPAEPLDPASAGDVVASLEDALLRLQGIAPLPAEDR